MSLTNTASPSLLFSFEGTTSDSVTNLTGTTTGAVSYVAGKYNQAVNINNPSTVASANYISYSLGSSFSSTSFTWAYWVNYGQVPAGSVQASVYFTDSAGSYTQFRLTLSNGRNQGQQLYMYNNATYLDSPVISQGTWYHVCVVLTPGPSGSTITFYFNSSLVGSFTGANNQTATLNNMYVGSANTQYGAVCAIDDLRLYNKPLNAAQVLAIYNLAAVPTLIAPAPTFVFTGQPVSPSLLWSFETSNVDSITGLAPSQMVGTPTYTQGKYGQAIQFVNTPPTSSQALYYTIPSSVGSMVNGLTVCFWLNPQSIPNPQNQTYVYIDGQVSGPTGAFWMFMDNGAATAPTLYGQNPTGSGYYPGIGTGTLPQGSWTHMTGVWTPYTGSSNTMTLYINGVFNSSVYYANAFTINRLTLATNAGSRGSPCIIDDLRIYNTVLTSSQIQSIYNQAAVPVTSISFRKS